MLSARGSTKVSTYVLWYLSIDCAAADVSTHFRRMDGKRENDIFTHSLTTNFDRALFSEFIGEIAAQPEMFCTLHLGWLQMTAKSKEKRLNRVLVTVIDGSLIYIYTHTTRFITSRYVIYTTA